MNIKKKKSALIMMLSTLLATTGCSDTNTNLDYQENAYEKVEEFMDSSAFYQDTHTRDTNEEFYSPFYNHYLNAFINYMNEDQYNTFMEMVQNVDESERYEFPVIYSGLANIMGEENDFGHGFYYAFNTRIIFESLFPAYIFRDDTFTHVNTLRDIVNNDEDFYKSLFSRDINKLIVCIMKNTSFEDRALVEEMILKFDLYVDKIEGNTYMDQKIKEEAASRIQEIMNRLVTSKCESDKEYAKSFYARMLKKSRYYGNNELSITRYLIEDTFDLTKENDDAYLCITLPNDYYFSNATLEQVMEEKLTSVIKKEITDGEHDMLSLLSLLVKEDTLESICDADSSNIRKYIYDDLSTFFQDENEFNEFCLRLNNGAASSLNEYFKIFKSRIKEEGITMLDFMRYYSLVELNKEHTYNHYEFYEDAEHMTYEELQELKPEEYENIAYNYPENYFLGSISYHEEFASIEDILSQNDLGFSNIYSSSQTIDWYTGSIDFDNLDDILVLSELVEPQSIAYDGNNFIFYECPSGYENGKVVDAFLNIDNELTIREQPGFSTTMVNPTTGDEMSIYLVGMNVEIENYSPLRFITEYSNVLNKEDTKKLTYEVTYE